MVGDKMINLSSYQKAIYEELVKLGYNVYDEVSEEAKFPYIVIGDIDFSEGQNNFNDLLDINLNILTFGKINITYNNIRKFSFFRYFIIYVIS